MASQFELFGHRRFTPMFLTQFLGAFNDNFFKQALLLVLTYMAANKMGWDVSVANNLAAMLFILPFFLFSALAGQLADKYEKSGLTVKIKTLEVVIMILAAIGLLFEIYWMLFVALFLLGAQSTFFGPIKYAYLPQAMHKDELVGANGLFQTGTSLSILLGMICAGFFAQMQNSVYWVSSMILVIAACGLLASKFVPNTPAVQPDLKINWNIFSTSADTIKYLYSQPLLFYIILGNSWFWFYGATFITQTPEVSKVILNGNEAVVIFLLTLFSVGVSVGSLLCKMLTKNQVSFKLLPFGIAGLSLFAIDLYFSLTALDVSNSSLLGVMQIAEIPGSYRVFADLFFLGFSGGIYIVPLYASMQAYSPVSHRARVIGANNIFNAIFMVCSALFAIFILSIIKLELPKLFVVTGVLNCLFGLFIYFKVSKLKDTMVISDDGAI